MPMRSSLHALMLMPALMVPLSAGVQADAKTAGRPDGIGALIAGAPTASGKAAEADAQPAEPADPRTGEASYEQARQLMLAIEAVLTDTADQRGTIKALPSEKEFLVPPLFTETREDRETRVRSLLDAALGIVTNVPVVDVQKRIEGHRRAIADLETQIANFRERQLMAPKDATLPGVLNDTVDSLAAGIKERQLRIEENRTEITKAKTEVHTALTASGIALSPEQLDLLLDGVLSGDLVRLVATFDAAKLIDMQLAKLIMAAGDNTAAARKYFAMHAALFAMLVHAQDMAIAKIDTQYLPKLDAILKDLQAAKSRTSDLLRADNRPDQKRALEANRESQKVAEDTAKAYRRYLQQQREQIARARQRATHDLKIADNTFETVQASFELQNLMKDGSASFEALQKLEAPTFEQIFRNEELRREFEALTRRLDAPTS